MTDKFGTEIYEGQHAVVSYIENGQANITSGVVSKVWSDDYCEVAVEGLVAFECGVEMQGVIGASSKAIILVHNFMPTAG